MPQDAIPLVAKTIQQPEETVSRSWRFHNFPAALPKDIVYVLAEEDQWVARTQQRSPLSREQLARFIDASVLKEAQTASR